MASTFQPSQPLGKSGSLADVLAQIRAQKKQQLQGLLGQSNAGQTPMSLMAPNQVKPGLLSGIVNGVLSSAGQGLGNKGWQALSGALSGANALPSTAAGMGAAEAAGAQTAGESAAMYAPQTAKASESLLESAYNWLAALL